MGVLQEPGRLTCLRRSKGGTADEVNSESDGTDTGESECLSSTEEAGELTREDPVEGRQASGHGIAGGKDGRDFEL